MSCIARLYCIVIGRLAGKICIAIQRLYCDSRDSGLLDCVVTQGRDTASQATTRRWAQAGQALGAQGARGARRRACVGRTRGRCRQLGARAQGSAGERARGRSGRARAWQGARGARGRAQQGRARARGPRCLATGCALDALGLFSIRIDSVLFLSRFLDIVREPGS